MRPHLRGQRLRGGHRPGRDQRPCGGGRAARPDQVLLPSGQRSEPATVIMFDPERDLALLQVPSARGVDHCRWRSAHAGATGAVFGHPNGQDALAVTPARVAREIDAVGRDLYDTPTPSGTSSSWPRPWPTATRAARSSTRRRRDRRGVRHRRRPARHLLRPEHRRNCRPPSPSPARRRGLHRTLPDQVSRGRSYPAVNPCCARGPRPVGHRLRPAPDPSARTRRPGTPVRTRRAAATPARGPHPPARTRRPGPVGSDPSARVQMRFRYALTASSCT